MTVELPHPLAGTVRLVASPIKLSATPVRYRRAPPLLGDDTDAVLAEFGFDAAAIAGAARAPARSERRPTADAISEQVVTFVDFVTLVWPAGAAGLWRRGDAPSTLAGGLQRKERRCSRRRSASTPAVAAGAPCGDARRSCSRRLPFRERIAMSTGHRPVADRAVNDPSARARRPALARAGLAGRRRDRRAADRGARAHPRPHRDRQDRPRRPARAARRGRAGAPGRDDRPAADALRVGPGAPVARGAAARGGAEERARAAHARDAGARHRPQARAQVGARHRRRLAPLQPAQRDARLGARQRARAHRLHGRLQDLAGARAADLPLRQPPGRPGRRERHDRRSRPASTRSPGA